MRHDKRLWNFTGRFVGAGDYCRVNDVLVAEQQRLQLGRSDHGMQLSLAQIQKLGFAAAVTMLYQVAHGFDQRRQRNH